MEMEVGGGAARRVGRKNGGWKRKRREMRKKKLARRVAESAPHDAVTLTSAVKQACAEIDQGMTLNPLTVYYSVKCIIPE